MMRKKYKSEKNAIHFSGVPLLTRDEPGLEQLISEHLSAAAKANNPSVASVFYILKQPFALLRQTEGVVDDSQRFQLLLNLFAQVNGSRFHTIERPLVQHKDGYDREY